MPFEPNINAIPDAPTSNTDLPAGEFPSIPRIATADLVGPVAANKQEKALERRDLTLQNRVNRLIDNNNLMDSRYVQVSDLTNLVASMITDLAIRRDGSSSACTAEVLLADIGLISSPAAAARLDMVVNRYEAGVQTVIGKVESAATVDADPDNTLVTKGWVDAAIGTGINTIETLLVDTSFTVPDGVTQILTVLKGAGGGSGGSGDGAAEQPGTGGDGGYIATLFTVTPGDVIPITVGVSGKKGRAYTIAAAPYRTGGAGGGGGGATKLLDAIAGGGGGGGGTTCSYGYHGAKGGDGGTAGTNGTGDNTNAGGAAGAGGTEQGGTGGAALANDSHIPGKPGSPGSSTRGTGALVVYAVAPDLIPPGRGTGGIAAPDGLGDFPGADGTGGYALVMYRL